MPDAERDSQWDWYNKALELDKRGRLTEHTFHPDDCQTGYYRMLDKSGDVPVWVAVGIWTDKNGERQLREDFKHSDRDPIWVFGRCNMRPIPFELYKHVRDGGEWPDTPPPLPKPDEPVAASTAFPVSDFVDLTAEEMDADRVVVPASDRVVERTDNLPEDVEPLTEKRNELQSEATLVAAWLKNPITTQEAADKASEWANRVARLKEWFESEYEIRNRPILEQRKVLQAQYLHPSQDAQVLVGLLTSAQTPFLTDLKKQRDAAAAEERRRQEAEAVEAAAAGKPPPEAAPARAPAKVASGGATGRRTGLSVEKTAEVIDYRLLSAFLITGGREDTPMNECRNPALKETLDSAAHRMAQTAMAETPLPGFRVIDRPKARR